MAKKLVKETVKGGWVARSAKTGRFVEAGTVKGISKSSTKTGRVLKEASARHSDALKRLVDR